MEQIKYSYVPTINLDQIRQGMTQVEKILNNNNLTDKQRKNFEQMFNSLTQEFTNYSTLVQRGFKKNIDLTNLDKAGLKIEKIFNGILNEYEDIDFSAIGKSFQADTTRAKELRETIVDIKNQIKDIGGKTLKDKGNAALSKISTVSSSGNVEKFRQGLSNNDIASMREAFNALKANEKRFTTEKGAVYSEELSKLEKVLEELEKNPALKNLVKDLNNVEEELASINQAEFNKLVEDFNKGKITTQQLSKAMIKLGRDTRATGEDQIKYNETLENFKSKIKYFVSLDAALGLVKKAIRDAYESVKELDAVMTQTAVVSEYTVEQMWETLPEKTAQANKYGVSIKGVYEVETLYYQQGLKANEVTAVGAETLKMAKISGLDYAAATDAMTAALRGFNMEVNAMNAQRVNDVYSALAAYTASDVEELSTAMTKTASISASAGMEFANTSAFLAKIIETTRESAETAGTAMKTIVARFTEIKNNPNTFTDENGEVVDVNKIDTALASVGVSLKDTEGQIRNLDDVFMDLAKIWDTLDKNTQRYIATISAGSRQQSRFIAMMSDYERTLELVNIANNSTGASQEQFEKTTDSLAYKLTQLKNAWDQFTQSLANNTVIKMAIDFLKGFLDHINMLINGFGLLNGGVGSFAIALTTLIGTYKLLSKVLGDKSPLMKILMNGPAGAKAVKTQIENGTNAAYNSIYKTFYGASYNGIKNGVSGAKIQTGGNNNNILPNKRNPLTKDLTLLKRGGVGNVVSKGFGKTYGSFSGFKSSMGGFVKGGGLASVLAGTAVGVELATSIIGKKFDPNNDKNRNKEERTEEIAKISKQRTEAIGNELKQIAQVSDSYKDQIATMKIANKGTKEYIQAQKEANKLIRDIVKNNPELKKSGNLKYENGNWVANEAFWKEYEDHLIQQQTEAEKQEMASDYANQLAQYEDQRDNSGVKLDTISDKEASDIQKTSKTAATVGGGIAGIAAGMAVGAAIGTVVPVIGNIVGAVVGGLVGLVGGIVAGEIAGNIATDKAKEGYSAEKVDKYTARIIEYRDSFTNEDIEKLAAGNVNDYQDMIKAFDGNTDEIKAFFSVYKDNSTELNNLLSKQVQRQQSDRELTDKLIETSNYNKDYGDLLRQEFTDAEAKNVGKQFEQGIEDFKGLAETDVTRLTYEQKAMTQMGFKKVGTKYYNDQGQEVSKEIAQEAAAQLYATDRAQKYVNELAEDFIDKAKEEISEGDNLGSSFYNKKGASLAAAKGINVLQENFELDENTISGIWNALGENASLAFTLAGSNTEAGINQFLAMLEKAGVNIETAFGGSVDEVREKFLSLGLVTENLSSKINNAAAVLNMQSKVKKGEGLTTEEFSALAALNSYSAAFYQKVGDLYYYIGNSVEDFSKDQINDAYQSILDYAKEVVDEVNGATKETLTEKALAAGTPEIFLTNLYTNEEAVGLLTAMARSLGATDADIQKVKEDNNGILSKAGLKNLVDELKIKKINEYNDEIIKTLKEKIYNAIIYNKQKEIDQLTKENKDIEESNQKVLEEIRNSVDKIRQDRENEKKEEELTDKELKLAYLKADTNASTAEIIATQKELNDSQESYIDTLIDQQLDNIEEANQRAADQRKTIITKLTDSLTEYKKSKEIWEKVEEKMDTFVKDGKVQAVINFTDFLREAAGYDSMSPEEQKEWESNLRESISALYSKTEKEDINSVIPDLVPTPKDSSEKDKKEGDGSITKMDSPHPINNPFGKQETTEIFIESVAAKMKAEQIDTKNGIYYPIMDENGIARKIGGSTIYARQDSFVDYQNGELGIFNPKETTFYAYKKGGLNTTTGPAWLDGTPSNPEMVLNARDTKNFILLKDILEDIMTNSSSSPQTSGDNYFDININVESISSDYDVERLSEKIKNEINNDARYRNVNSINLVR